MSETPPSRQDDDNAAGTRPAGIDRLLEVMARLRDPAGGCPWDLEQSFETIAPYTIEEAYEVAEAIRQDDREALRDELGDLLLQVVFHAQMAREDGSFDFDEVARGIADKMVRRHPNVFGDDDSEACRSARAQMQSWEAQKAAERDARAHAEGRRPSVLDGVALALPALLRAEKLQKRAARVGFDWPDTGAGVRQGGWKRWPSCGRPRRQRVRRRRRTRPSRKRSATCCLPASIWRDISASSLRGALRAANAKFTARFHHVEMALADSGARCGQGGPRRAGPPVG